VDTAGENEKEVYSKDMKAAAAQRLSLPDLPKYDEAAVEFGLPAKRVMRISFTIGGKPFTLSDTLNARRSWIDKWSVVGMFRTTGAANSRISNSDRTR